MVMRSFSEFLSSGHERFASRLPADAARITAGSRRGPESRIFAQIFARRHSLSRFAGFGGSLRNCGYRM
jgi:hypothetical protein